MKFLKLLLITFFLSCNYQDDRPNQPVDIISNQILAKITQVKGDVKLNNNIAIINSDLNNNNIIVTGKQSYAILEFKDIGRMVVKQNTVISITSLSDYNLELAQTQGTTLSKIDRKGIRYTILTPTSVTATRGNINAIFEISTDAKASSIKLFDGKLFVASTHNEVLYLEKGETVDVTNLRAYSQKTMTKIEVDQLQKNVTELENNTQVFENKITKPKNLTEKQLRLKFGKLNKITLNNGQTYFGGYIRQDDKIFIYTEQGNLSINANSVVSIIAD